MYYIQYNYTLLTLYRYYGRIILVGNVTVKIEIDEAIDTAIKTMR